MIEKILEYQHVESEIIAGESELVNSKDRQKASEIQQILKNQHARLVTLEKSAERVNSAYRKATAKYQDYLKKLAAFVEKQGDNAQTWIYVFNMIPTHIIPKVKSLMMCYEILFLPIYTTTEIPKKIKKIIEKW